MYLNDQTEKRNLYNGCSNALFRRFELVSLRENMKPFWSEFYLKFTAALAKFEAIDRELSRADSKEGAQKRLSAVMAHMDGLLPDLERVFQDADLTDLPPFTGPIGLRVRER
jgi:hypothetical protein